MHIPDFFYSAEVSCWIFTGERQTAVIRSKYVQVLLNQDMSFFDTYGNNGDIVSQVLSDVLLIQSAISEKVSSLTEVPICYPEIMTCIFYFLHFRIFYVSNA
jgi:ABC-type multidrug transport system fused ATPase/permease subunit